MSEFDINWYNLKNIPLEEALEAPLVKNLYSLGLYPDLARDIVFDSIQKNPYMMIHNCPIYEEFENIDDDIMFEVFLDAYNLTHGNTKLMYEALQYGNSFYVCEGILQQAADTEAGKGIRRAANEVKNSTNSIFQSIENAVDNLSKFNTEEEREAVITGSYYHKIRYLFKKVLMFMVGKWFLLALPIGGLAGIAIKLIGLIVMPILKWNTIFKGGYSLTVGNGQVTSNKMKIRVLQELELELKMTREKIDDAKAAGDKKAKYALMRIENKIEQEIVRIKYNDYGGLEH